jgi:hypothetical protein
VVFVAVSAVAFVLARDRSRDAREEKDFTF